jgi:type IV secretory pathway TrbL component
MAEAAVPGDMSSADVNMRPADMSMVATGEAAEVTAGKVGTSKVASSSKMTAASTPVSAASTAVTAASATSESHRGNCRTAQKGSDREHRQCFSNHRGLLDRFSEH